MKWALPVLLASLTFLGCSGGRKAPVPSGRFRVTRLSDISDPDVLVRHYSIEAVGTHSVKVTEGKGSEEELRVDPVPGAKTMRADLYFVATLSPINKTESALKWLVRIKGGLGSQVGGPDTWSVQDVSRLGGILKIDLPEGEHPLRAPISLGQLQNNEIILTVK